ncbi:MAG: c-type cytochrome biogenesis protein CcsB [Syntrophales bacterium]|nr:c-type cytochrome biogenesis protein CcsB [Syntrophales bacterium]
MDDTFLISIATFVYFASALVFLIAVVSRSRGVQRAATVIVAAGFVIQTVSIDIRWVLSYRLGIGHAPLSNFYESLVFFSWSLIVVLFFAQKRYGNGLIGAILSFFSFILLASASLSGSVDTRIQPLIPALQSNWLISHVISAFLAYACFALSFGAGTLYLLTAKIRGRLVSRLPSPVFFDELAYRSISVGFLLLTFGIITGAVWADTAWGRYWGWDPKETWSLITWMLYGAYLHARLVRGWTGAAMAVISIAGFFAVIFTYLGVNYILSGLHSYM